MSREDRERQERELRASQEHARQQEIVRLENRARAEQSLRDAASRERDRNDAQNRLNGINAEIAHMKGHRL